MLERDQIAERGARLARRDDREYREYLREEQRRQAGCPAREVVPLPRDTSRDSTDPVQNPYRDGALGGVGTGYGPPTIARNPLGFVPKPIAHCQSIRRPLTVDRR